MKTPRQINRLANTKIRNYVNSELKYPKKGLTVKKAVIIFCNEYSITIDASKHKVALNYLFANNLIKNLKLLNISVVIPIQSIIKVVPKKKVASKKTIALGKKLGTKHPLAHLFNKSYSSFLKSAYWSKVRLTVLKRDNYTCICGEKKYLQVHHKTYKNHFNEHKHLEDLITLCRNCHKKEHNIK